MNVNLMNSIYMQPKSFGKEGTSLKKGTFSDSIISSFGLVKPDSYPGLNSSATVKTYGKLDKEDYNYLSSKWNPENMTQDDYDEFLDYLEDEGIITEEDKEYVGYGGMSRGIFEPSGSYYPLEIIPVYGLTDGNLLAFTRFESSIIHSSAEGKHVANLFKKITGVLEGMVMRREE